MPGKQGWATQTLSNSLLSDLVPGFNLQFTHDLWDREVSNDSAKFAPFLQSVSASFGLIGQHLPRDRLALRAGQAAGPDGPSPGGPQGGIQTSIVVGGGVQQRTLYATNQLSGARRPFTANVNLTISRTRANEQLGIEASSNSTLGLLDQLLAHPVLGRDSGRRCTTSRTKAFDGQVIRLERDLHDWRAGFNFVKNPNGNFALYFSIHLVDLPDLKLDYNQTSHPVRP